MSTGLPFASPSYGVLGSCGICAPPPPRSLRTPHLPSPVVLRDAPLKAGRLSLGHVRRLAAAPGCTLPHLPLLSLCLLSGASISQGVLDWFTLGFLAKPNLDMSYVAHRL